MQFNVFFNFYVRFSLFCVAFVVCTKITVSLIEETDRNFDLRLSPTDELTMLKKE